LKSRRFVGTFSRRQPEPATEELSMRMIPRLLAVALSCLGALATPALAQQLELPRPSPLAKVSQMVGLTEVAVEYSSPAVKGRTIFGGLLPWDQLWRTGANSATKITFSKDVTVAGTAVPAGSYAIFTIPGKQSWTVILNKNTNQGGTGQYKKELDQLRFQAKPEAIPNRERLAFVFNDFNESSASLALEWEKVRVVLPIGVHTDEQALANIKAMTDGSWRPYTSAARYLLEQKKDYDAGLKLVDQSIALHEDWLNVWTKAQLLAAKGNKKEAHALAEKSRSLGEKAGDGFFFADEVKKAIAEWKGK
jgi:hypothetical protein